MLGPGLLFAATSIGVSHLVQSTRAGATSGILMLLFVLLACVNHVLTATKNNTNSNTEMRTALNIV